MNSLSYKQFIVKQFIVGQFIVKQFIVKQFIVKQFIVGQFIVKNIRRVVLPKMKTLGYFLPGRDGIGLLSPNGLFKRIFHQVQKYGQKKTNLDISCLFVTVLSMYSSNLIILRIFQEVLEYD